MNEAVAELHALAELRHRDADAALRRAAAATNDPEPEVAATAWWVVGLARHELGDLPGAVDAYRAALDSPAPKELAAMARASLAISLLGLGDRDGANAEIAKARQQATGDGRGFVAMLDGLVLQRAGRLGDALDAYGIAQPLLRKAGDRASLARMLLNRGILHAYRGESHAALRDLRDSEDFARQLDLPVLVAMAAHNTGFTLGRRGDVPGALQGFDRARDAYAVLGEPPRLVGVLAADRCEVLLEAGLTGEAREAAEAAMAALAEAGEIAHLDEARLLAARACLADGDDAAALATATAAATAFRSAGRGSWATLADYVAIQAEVRATEDQRRPPARLLHRTRKLAAALEAHGWPVEAAHVRTFVGRMALATGRTAEARTDLAATASARHRGSAHLKVQAWHATALLHLADGNRTAAKRALRQGLAAVDRYRTTLGASDLRAHAAAHGAGLAQLGLRLAIADGRPLDVLRWAERNRAGALWLPPAKPPDDERLAAELTDLRQQQAALREAILAGAPTSEATKAVVAAERDVQRRARAVRGDTGAGPGAIDAEELRRALGERTLVEYASVDGTLHAVVLDADGARLVAAGPADAVVREKTHLLSAMRRQLARPLRPDGTWASDGLAARAINSAASRLDDLLIAPLGLPPATALVISPTGAGHGLPWAALPTLAGRPVTIAPSASLWLRPPGTRRRRGPLLVAGPDLPGGDHEVAALGKIWSNAHTLTGPDATVDEVLARWHRGDLVHIAAHGTFRADSPLFSSLRLADGMLTVYDLERAAAAPRTVVLPACSAGVVDVRAGDELLGTAAALLGLGVRSVVAPVLPVPDRATTPFSIALHQRLAAGDAPSEALAEAGQLARAEGDAAAAIVAAAFVCIGTDEGRRPAGRRVSARSTG